MYRSSSNSNYIILGLVAIITVIAIVYLMQPKDDDLSADLSRAAEELTDGFKNAADELKPNKTAGEKFGDALEDAGDSIKDATSN